MREYVSRYIEGRICQPPKDSQCDGYDELHMQVASAKIKGCKKPTNNIFISNHESEF